MTSKEIRERITQIGLRRSIVFPSGELYGPVGGFYDYGPVGAAIRRRIADLWRKHFIGRQGFFEVESPLVLPEIVVKASGHLDHFTDPVTTCKFCGSKFRADHLLEENELHVEGKTIDDINRMIKESKIVCLNCGKEGFGDISFFNLMFKTNIGPIEGVPGYGRPETAQGIFLMFSRLFRTYGKLPLGVAQIGRALRNEIAPRQGLLRMREFSQMELEYFFDPADQGMKGYESVNGYKLNILTEDEQEKQGKGKGQAIQLTCDECIERNLVPNQIMAYFMVSINEFLKLCGIPEEQIRHRQIPTTERAHYSAGTFDIEAKTSYGWTELVGIAYRTDYDLRSHMEMSKKDLTVVTPDGRRFIPHVVEPSFGMDRIFWAALEHAYKKGEDRGWEWLDLPLVLSPYDVAIFPLMKKDGLAEKAQEVTGMLRSSSVSALYDESGSIGKRYARADEVGIKWAVTIDYDTLKDNTVTLRDRNTTKQERINIADIASKISSK